MAGGPIDELEAKLLGVISEYRERIRESYKKAGPDPQAVDGAIDALVASVIRALEEAGYRFDTGSLDNVLYNLGRRLRTVEGGWEVVE
jgi:hypothetical protein